MADTEDRLDQLESLVEQQQETIDRQQERIEALRAERDIATGDSDASTETDSSADTDGITATTRRGVLTAGGMLALFGLGTGAASADPQGQVGTSSDPLEALYTEELNGGVTGNQSLTDLTGSNLSINGGALEASGGGSSSSELVTSGNGDTAFQVVDGTSDVSNAGSTIDAPNVVGGHPNNNTTGGPKGAFIGGGGRDGTENTVSANYTTIGGGIGNEASSLYATVGGGKSNTADGRYSFVAGRLADTNGNDGAFVWGDSTPSSVTAGAADQVVFQAGGGFAIEAGGLSVEGGNLDLSGNNLETSSGGLTVTTNDNGDLTLDPGRSNQLVLNNQSTASSGSLLAIDGSGNVVEADSTTLGDVGGGGGGSSSELVTSGNGDTAFQVVDGGSNVSNAGSTIDAPNVVGGHPDNKTENGPEGAFIGGGGSDGSKNTVSADHTTIGGGIGNTASVVGATVGGGTRNTASGGDATAGGGFENTASTAVATVGGGARNTADAYYATVGGGSKNTADASSNTSGTPNPFYATVGGGIGNTASGSSATVPGGALGAATDDNSFVWNDGSGYHEIPYASSEGLSSNNFAVSSNEPTGEETFSVSAQGGVRFITGSQSVTYIDARTAGWTTASTRSAKTNIDPVDPEAILDGVTEMEVATWEYKDDDGEGAGTRHVGPMAEDFHEVVDVGTSDDHINSINADGVALAAIQGLSKTLDETQADLDAKDARIADQQDRTDTLESRLDSKDDRVDALEREIERKDDRVETLEDENEQLRAENETLRERVAAIEAHVGLGDAGEEMVADD